MIDLLILYLVAILLISVSLAWILYLILKFILKKNIDFIKILNVFVLIGAIVFVVAAIGIFQEKEL